MLSTNFQDAKLTEVINQLTSLTGLTILKEFGVNGNISGRIKALPVEAGLKHLLFTNGFSLRRDGQVYLVGYIHQSASNTSSPKNKTNWISLSNNKIDFELNDAPLPWVLEELSRQTGENFYLLGTPKKKINARAREVTMEQVLRLLLLDNDYGFKLLDKVYLIGEKSSPHLRSSQLLPLKHMKVEAIIDLLPQTVASQSEITIVREHNALLLSGTRSVIREINSIVESLDLPIPQIFLEILVIDFRQGETNERSIEAGLINGSSSDSTLIGNSILRFVPGVSLFTNGAGIKDYLKSNTRNLGEACIWVSCRMISICGLTHLID